MTPTIYAGNLKKTLLRFFLIPYALSILNSFFLRLVYAYFIEGNVKFSFWETPFNTLISVLDIVCVFSGLAIAVYGIMLFGIRHTKSLLSLNFGTVFLSYLCTLGVSYFCMTPSLFLVNLGNFLLNIILNLLIYLVIFSLIFLTSVFHRKHLIKKGTLDLTLTGQIFSPHHPLLRSFHFMTLIYIATALIEDVISTVTDLSEYGLPVNKTEWIYEITPYGKLILCYFIGFSVSVIVAYAIQMKLKQKSSVSSGNTEKLS